MNAPVRLHGRARVWSAADMARLKRLTADGVALARIAVILARDLADVRAHINGTATPAVCVPLARTSQVRHRPDRDEITAQMWRQGFATTTIADRFGVSVMTVLKKIRTLRERGVDVPMRRRGKQGWTPQRWALLARLWADPALSAADIATQLGLGPAHQVYAAVQRARAGGGKMAGWFPSHNHLRTRRGKTSSGAPHPGPLPAAERANDGASHADD